LFNISNFISIGKIISSFGKKGEIKLSSFLHPKNDIFKYNIIYIENYENPVEIKLHRSHKIYFIASINKKYDKKQINLFVKKYLYIDKFFFFKKNRYCLINLIGLEVYNKKNNYIGIIIQIYNTKINNLIYIKKYRKKIYIPYTNKYIIKINFKQKYILINN